MKIVLSVILCLLTLVACDGQGKSENQNSTSSQVLAQKQTKLSRQKACDVLTNEEVANLLNVEEAEIQYQDMSFGEKRSICYYYTKEGNRKFFIRLAWKSEKAAANKILENQYVGYLANGEKEIDKYREVEKTSENQILFGIGQDDEGKHIHILRKRFGNNAEVQIELTKEQRDEEVESQLNEILDLIK